MRRSDGTGRRGQILLGLLIDCPSLDKREALNTNQSTGEVSER